MMNIDLAIIDTDWISKNQDIIQHEIHSIIESITDKTPEYVFDILEKIQHYLAIALWKDNVHLNNFLDEFTRFFDRLDSKDERKYIRYNINSIKEKFSALNRDDTQKQEKSNC